MTQISRLRWICNAYGLCKLGSQLPLQPRPPHHKADTTSQGQPLASPEESCTMHSKLHNVYTSKTPSQKKQWTLPTTALNKTLSRSLCSGSRCGGCRLRLCASLFRGLRFSPSPLLLSLPAYCLCTLANISATGHLCSRGSRRLSEFFGQSSKGFNETSFACRLSRSWCSQWTLHPAMVCKMQRAA